MDVEDEIFLDDDLDVINIINFGFPRQIHVRSNFFDDMDDMNFYRRFRLTKEATLHVLQMIEEILEFDNDLNNSVSPINQLLTTLAFYASNSHQIHIADLMGMNQSTVSRIVLKVSRAVAGLRERFIKMPSNFDERTSCQTNFFQKARFPRVVGCIDCTHIKIRSPGGEDAEIFRNRKSYFSINVQAVCGSDLCITNIVARWPGSTHDATIFNNSRLRTRLEDREFHNGIILGDSGYPLRNYLLTPLGNPTTVGQRRYNESHIRTRNAIERTFGVWKRRFPALCYGLRCKVDTAMIVIVATAVLHNIATNMHDELPPLPDGINEEELEYLIQQGQIPQVQVQQNNAQGVNNAQGARNSIINYFSNL